MLPVQIIVAQLNRSEREALGLAIKSLRPNVEVLMIDPAQLRGVVIWHQPHLVICDQLTSLRHGQPFSWVLLGSELADFAVIQLDQKPMRLSDPGLDDLLSIIDEAVRIHQKTH